jgi:hypothetical protein
MSAVDSTRLEYAAKEVAAMVGVSYESFRKPRVWRRYGGKKRGGRIVFSLATVRAIAEGRQ